MTPAARKRDPASAQTMHSRHDMTTLHLSDPVRRTLGATLRPGSELLTRRMLELAAPEPGGMSLDAGCGTGATLALLRDYGLRPLGLDLDATLLGEARKTGVRAVRGDLARLPLAPACMNLVICECAWNLTDKSRAMTEFARVLRPGGRLLLSDIFARGETNSSWPVRCCFAQAATLDDTRKRMEAAGFAVEALEDHSPLLARTAAEFVFRHGSLHGFWRAVTGDEKMAAEACQAAQSSRPGLFLLVAVRKPEVPTRPPVPSENENLKDPGLAVNTRSFA